MRPENLCVGEARVLKAFVKEIFSYEFAEEPNYTKLRFTLTKCLLELDVSPDLKFDWSKF
jgi:hypothetical protein